MKTSREKKSVNHWEWYPHPEFPQYTFKFNQCVAFSEQNTWIPHVIWHWVPFARTISQFSETGVGLPPPSPYAYELQDLRGSTDEDKPLKISVSYVLSDSITSFTAMVLAVQVSSASIIFKVTIFRIWFPKSHSNVVQNATSCDDNTNPVRSHPHFRVKDMESSF